jgi:hypothetical protein
MRRPVPTLAALAPLFALCAGSASAQATRASQFLDNCHNNSRNNSEQFCEVRDFTVAPGASLRVNGRDNGGIAVHGWDRNETKVTAMVQVQAATEAEAAVIAKAIAVNASGAEVAATGPDTRGYRESWSVSYEIWAPRHTDLSLTASNGGVAVDGVDSKMDLETVNGGLSLVDVDGDVRGTTSNGGVTAQLSGDRWRGAGLDLRTANGGVRISVPTNYSARLEASTVNGGMHVDVPMTVQGTLGRSLHTSLGNGGAMIRATTTNGGVTLTRR